MAPNPLLRSQAAASAQKFVRRDVRRRHRVQRPRGNADVSSAGVERPRGADWCDRIGGLRGVACGHSRDADEDVGVPSNRNNRHRGHQAIPLRPRIRNYLQVDASLKKFQERALLPDADGKTGTERQDWRGRNKYAGFCHPEARFVFPH